MKKIFKIVALLSIICGIFTITACGKKEENNEESKITITDNELKNIAGFINNRATYGKNNISTATQRLELINFILMNSNLTNTYEGNEGQETTYVKKEDYRKKYEEIFGTNYSLETDIKDNDVTGMVYNDCDNEPELANKDNVCWNNAWGITGTDLTTKIDSQKVEKDTFIVTGTFTKKSNNTSYDSTIDTKDVNIEGTFKIKYSIKDNNKYLLSIIFTNK